MKAADKDLFKGRHFDQQAIILRDLAQMMGERGIEVAHTTILRWVQR